MKNISLRALGAFIFTAGLVLAGVATPANAAQMNVAVTASGGTVGTTGTNAYPIMVTFSTVTAGSTNVQVVLPSGWSFVDFHTICSHTTISTQLGPIGCFEDTTSTVDIDTLPSYTPWTQVDVEFAVGTINTGTNRVFTVNAKDFYGGTTQDSGVSTLAGGSSSNTVTFDANGGNGTTAAQTASTSTTLTANGFSRSGYTFTGWNTAANGSGSSYANGASYAFTSSTTLYALWSANSSGSGSSPTGSNSLADTGVNNAIGTPSLIGGFSLATVGVVMLMIARRNRGTK